MGKLCLMTTIVSRKQLKKYLRLYQEEQLQVMFITLGAGTASGDILDYLGLESTEKAVLFHVLEESVWESTKRICGRSFRLTRRGRESHLSCR